MCIVFVVVGCNVCWIVVCVDCGKGGVVVCKIILLVNDILLIFVINDVRLFLMYVMFFLLSVNLFDICFNLLFCLVIFWIREEIRVWLFCN